jgi:hypothetical protein
MPKTVDQRTIRSSWVAQLDALNERGSRRASPEPNFGVGRELIFVGCSELSSARTLGRASRGSG